MISTDCFISHELVLSAREWEVRYQHYQVIMGIDDVVV